MELTLLTVPGCPHAEAFGEVLAIALSDHPDVLVHRREITDERAATIRGDQPGRGCRALPGQAFGPGP